MEHENAICDYIKKNLCTTLGELIDKLTDQHQLTVAKSTVFRQLDAMTYSLKQVRFEPERADTPENKEKCKILLFSFGLQLFSISIEKGKERGNTVSLHET